MCPAKALSQQLAKALRPVAQGPWSNCGPKFFCASCPNTHGNKKVVVLGCIVRSKIVSRGACESTEHCLELFFAVYHADQCVVAAVAHPQRCHYTTCILDPLP